jgi:hypothetical protein
MALYATGRVAFSGKTLANPCSDQHYCSYIWDKVKSTLHLGNNQPYYVLQWADKINSTRIDLVISN